MFNSTEEYTGGDPDPVDFEDDWNYGHGLGRPGMFRIDVQHQNDVAPYPFDWASAMLREMVEVFEKWECGEGRLPEDQSQEKT